MKILVVDDEKTLVKGMKFNLENEGYQVECAYDGAAAVELARNERFDLLILDVMMPELDGLEACMRIREFSNVPIIMLTAKSEDADKLMGFECGADDYLTKPFNILELKARVRALLRRADGGQPFPEYGGTGGCSGRSGGGSHRQGIRPDGTADAQSPPRIQPGKLDERGMGLRLCRRLSHCGCSHSPSERKTGSQSGRAGSHHDQVGSGVLFQGVNEGCSVACRSNSV